MASSSSSRSIDPLAWPSAVISLVSRPLILAMKPLSMSSPIQLTCPDSVLVRLRDRQLSAVIFAVELLCASRVGSASVTGARQISDALR